MKNSQIFLLFLHYLSLAFFIIIAAFLRFWHLDLKPLWMDEVITAIFSLGKNYQDLPLGTVLSLDEWSDFFTLKSGVSCSQIAENIATQSTHPPLFFCGMYKWLSWLNFGGENWVIQLRSLPAICGVLEVFTIYLVNRIAFGLKAGITAAGLMSVSPFAVYLSQEARHYTLPMLMITLSLIGLMQIQRDIVRSRKINLVVWLGWIVANSISIWVHYFCILAFVAQILTLISLIYWQRIFVIHKIRIWLILTLSSIVICLSFLPWLPTLINHFTRSETEWLHPPSIISPIYQTLANWLIVFVSFPVEQQPLIIAIVCGLLMLGIGIWIGIILFSGFKLLWKEPPTHTATFTLTTYLTWILLEFLAIAYLLGKDITAIPRYSFVYFPVFCALAAACLWKHQSQAKNKENKNVLYTFLCIGVLSSIIVISNLAFKKPFLPEQVAQTINQESSIPLLVVVGYKNNQDVALGLSYAIALDKEREKIIPIITHIPQISSQEIQAQAIATKAIENPGFESKKEVLIASSTNKRISLSNNTLIEQNSLSPVNFAFFSQKPNFQNVWSSLAKIKPQTLSPLNLWVVAPGLKRREYPQQVQLSSQIPCKIDPKQHYRIGIPYQLYRCGDFKKL